MTTSHVDFIEFAINCDLESSEFTRRNAASRAYYGAFNGCTTLCDTYNVPKFADTNGGAHEQLIDALINCVVPDSEFQKSAKSLGVQLQQIKKIRRHADYKLDEPFDSKDADFTLHYSKRIVERVNELLKDAAA